MLKPPHPGPCWQWILVTVCFLSIPAQADNLVTRLRQAKSLACEYTDNAVTVFKEGHRTITMPHDKGRATYDNIDIKSGTARIISNSGAADIHVSWQADALWFIETAPNGNLVFTTIFPSYAAGTDEFIVIESRHWKIFQVAGGEQASGTCKVLE